jgi:hypothetical protein
MEAAYDIKGLVEELKLQGLELAEEGAKVVINGVFNWLEKSADMSTNPYDDVAKVIYPKVRAYALQKAEEINGAG